LSRAERHKADGHPDGGTANTDAEDASHVGDVVSLRGAAPASVRRRYWLFSAVTALVVFALIIVVSFISATNDNATIQRLKTHGIPVNVTVTSCIGNIGGSGSNSAGYTCRGVYHVGADRFDEIIGSMTNFSAPGTSVSGEVDPAKHGTVELASAVRGSTASAGAFVPPGLMCALLIILAMALRRTARRS